MVNTQTNSNQEDQELLEELNEIAASILRQINRGVSFEQFPDRSYTYSCQTAREGTSATLDTLASRGLMIIKREIRINFNIQHPIGVPHYIVMFLFYRNEQLVACLNMFSFAQDYINDVVTVNGYDACTIDNVNITSQHINNINEQQQSIIDFVISQDSD